jgi:choline dehydrogenase-like flavoprotein
MFFDSRKLSHGSELDTDVCIVGAGPAGITLAKEFINQSFRVCLLEGGDLNDFNEDIASLGDGEIVGDTFPPLRDMRRRQFGGMANKWSILLNQRRIGVRYADLDAIDFEKRDWVPYSGWPITKEDVIPFYKRAHVFCQLGPYDYTTKPWETESDPRVLADDDRITSLMFKFGPSNIYTDEYRVQIDKSSNITTYVNANVIEIEADETAQTIKRVHAACLTGNRFSVSAKIFILATGGLENARLLLLSNRVQTNGLGNQYDVVGRYFMDHPIMYPGHLLLKDASIVHSMGLYDKRHINGETIMGRLALSENILRRDKLLQMSVMLFPRDKTWKSDGKTSFRTLLTAVNHGKVPTNLLRHIKNIAFDGDDLIADLYQNKIKKEVVKPSLSFGGWSAGDIQNHEFVKLEIVAPTEQAPHPDNRVTLTKKMDKLGSPQMKLTNYWNEIDKDSVRRAQATYSKAFMDAGLGYTKFPVLEEQEVGMSSHHNMGTTRMNENPRFGVVDADCKVHGISNLFMAGSSVFPTGGFANPTLTLVALAIRLADHLKDKLKP